MNYLAHLWLADRAQADLAGAVLGDVVRGRLEDRFPGELALSIRLHRRVDALTDRHPDVVDVRRSFGAGSRRYAGVLIDVVLDHCLARDWQGYSAEPLPGFAQRCGVAVHDAAGWFRDAGAPTPSPQAFRELLLSYADEAGVDRALRQISARLSRAEDFMLAADGWRGALPLVAARAPAILEDVARAARDFVRGSAAR